MTFSKSRNPLVTCQSCGWVSFQVTRADAIADVERFNKYFDGLSADKQELYYGGRKSSIKEYERCFSCGGSYTNFRKAKEGDCPNGVTLNPIISRKE